MMILVSDPIAFLLSTCSGLLFLLGPIVVVIGGMRGHFDLFQRALRRRSVNFKAQTYSLWASQKCSLPK